VIVVLMSAPLGARLLHISLLLSSAARIGAGQGASPDRCKKTSTFHDQSSAGPERSGD
jgi:hypothetical protein